MLYLDTINHKGSTHMTVKLEAFGNDANEMIAALGGYSPAAWEIKCAQLRDMIAQRNKFEELYGELSDRYDAQAKVRDETAANLATALKDNERLSAELSQLQHDIEIAIDRIKNLDDKIKSHDPGPDEPNKTLFNLVDVARRCELAFDKGYKKGLREQQAEHAAEKVHAKTDLAAMLGFTTVSIQLGHNAPFDFDPYRVERYGTFRGNSDNAVPGGPQRFKDHVVGIVGISHVSGKMLWFAATEIDSWTGKALA